MKNRMQDLDFEQNVAFDKVQAEVWKVWHRSFNPHTHAGCDRRGYVSYLLEEVSIHTPTQGVTTINASIYI